MAVPEDEAHPDLMPGEGPSGSAIVRSNARRSISRGAGYFMAWVAFLCILGVLSVRNEAGFDRFVRSLADREYGKLGFALFMGAVVVIALTPFIAAAKIMVGCFELATGRPIQQLEDWFGGLHWLKKCIVVPALAAPIGIVSYGLIFLGAYLVRHYVKR